MSELLNSERFTLAQVAERLGVHLTTVWRWALNGVRGRRLRSHLVGGRRYVTAGDLDLFLADRSRPQHDGSAERRTRRRRRHANSTP